MQVKFFCFTWINTKQLATHTIYGTSITKLFRCKERSTVFRTSESLYENQHDEIHYKTISIAFIIIIKGRNQLSEDYTQQQHLT